MATVGSLWEEFQPHHREHLKVSMLPLKEGSAQVQSQRSRGGSPQHEVIPDSMHRPEPWRWQKDGVVLETFIRQLSDLLLLPL